MNTEAHQEHTPLAIAAEIIAQVHLALQQAQERYGATFVIESYQERPSVRCFRYDSEGPPNSSGLWQRYEGVGCTIEAAAENFVAKWFSRPSVAASKRAQAAKLIAEAEQLEAVAAK